MGPVPNPLSNMSVVMLTHRLRALKILVQQILRLKQCLKNTPLLGDFEFQGKPLSFYVSGNGMLRSLIGAFQLNFDPIALNHGIQRVQFPWSETEVIWSHKEPTIDVITADEITKTLEDNYQTIKSEILTVMDSREDFPDSDTLTNASGHWSHLNFYQKTGEPNEDLHNKCPNTSNLLKKLPINLQFGFCMVSVLEPNTQIAAHRGSSTLRQRYHLCLESREPELSKIRVGEHWINWTPGVAFGFNDSVEHEVKHASDTVRVVLIVDTWPSSISQEATASIVNNPEILNFGVVDRIVEPVNISD